jgi:DNA-binding NarL/FixJ family response regulator
MKQGVSRGGKMTKFLVADDHPIMREALINALAPHFDSLTCVQSDSLDSTLHALQQYSDIDLVLLDLQMPGCELFYGVMRVTHDFPNVPIVIVSANNSPQIVAKTIGFGAKGFIPKATPTEQIVQAINTILAGGNWLPPAMSEQVNAISKEQLALAKKVAEITPKQFQVLRLVQDGLLNKQIASDLNITEATVKAHISAVFRKLEVNTRTQAVLAMEKLQLEH